MDIWHSRKTTGLRRNGFHRRPERSHCFRPPILRQPTLTWTLITLKPVVDGRATPLRGPQDRQPSAAKDRPVAVLTYLGQRVTPPLPTACRRGHFRVIAGYLCHKQK